MTGRRLIDTRAKLLEAGLAAFRDQGFHGTGIQEVVKTVGVPKGSFYNYFESKDEFGAAVIRHYAECMGAKLAAACEGAADARSGLRAFFETEMREFEAARFVGGCLVANLGGELEGSDICRDALAAAMGGYVAGIVAAVARAQNEGTIRADVPAEALGRLLVDAWEGAVIRMKIERSLAPLRDCLARLLDGFFRPDPSK